MCFKIKQFNSILSIKLKQSIDNSVTVGQALASDDFTQYLNTFKKPIEVILVDEVGVHIQYLTIISLLLLYFYKFS